jgi:MFS family permease
MLNRIRFGHFSQALSHRGYRIFAIANAASILGTWMQRVAVGWLAWDLTHSTFWVGVVAFSDFFPVVLLGLIAGAVTDRVSREAMFRTSQALMLVQAATLAVLSMSGLLEIHGLVVLSLVHGVLFSFNQPIRMTIVSYLLPRADLPTGIALNSIIQNTARFIGPAIAGVIIVLSNISLVFLINALSFVPMIWGVSRMSIPGEIGSSKSQTGFLQSIPAGLSYVRSHIGIGLLLLLLLAAGVLVRCFVELLPAFAGQVYGGEADTLAILVSTVGAGAIVGGVLTASPSSVTEKVNRALLSSAVSAVGVLGLVMTDWLWLGIASVFVGGFGMTSSAIMIQALVQNSVADAVRGRVLALYGMLWRGGGSVGALLIGSIADRTGLRPTFAVSAVLFCVICAVIATYRERIAIALETS